MITPDRPSSVNDLAYPTTPHRIEGITIKLFVAKKNEQSIHPASNTIISPPSSDDTSNSSTTDNSDEEPIKSASKSQPTLSSLSESDSSTATSDSDNSDDSVVVSKQSVTNQPINNMSKSFQISSGSSTSDSSSDSSTSDSSESEDDSDSSTSDSSSDSSNKDDQPAKKAKTVSIIQTNSKNISQPKQQSTTFKRVDPGKVKVNDNFKSNKFVDKPGAFGSYGQKAYEDFSNTRGKGFRQEKNKKKRGSYRGGAIDTGVHSIKFNDSD